MENTKKEYGRFQWFLFVILIPLVFTVTLAAIILSVAGVNVAGTAKEWVSGLTGSAQDKKAQTASQSAPGNDELKRAEIENKELAASVTTQKQEIKAMENDVLLKEKKIASLSKEVEDLKAQLKQTASVKTEQKDIAKLYEGMSANKAADILPLLGEDDAMKILGAMKDDQVTSILEKMTPENAALYTGKLADSEGGE
ncbi:hypothetical protein J9317_09460 [Metabacillus sp. KIGAM252]|uniref:Magnesium transporter MgtE intracellular domain-containing protein n=1 Tax=Metabacillus flavus TaxID=2823519 RepID=A0ABS5LE10_9BACI|nr:hypothetical protein [Metabacillus flavus]MBS2968986.1 hypothetical protein [Metabacillus flavus]